VFHRPIVSGWRARPGCRSVTLIHEKWARAGCYVDAEAWAADRRREIARGKARGGLAGKRLACADALAVRQAVAHRVPAGFLLGDLRETTLGAHGMVALEMHRKP